MPPPTCSGGKHHGACESRHQNRMALKMTKPWRVDVLKCRGSSYHVGKQMAESFLKTTRGSTLLRRKGHQPFGFS
jgi:hypothetical protein